jgi:hypothetical protein
MVLSLSIWTLFWFVPALLLHPVYYSINKSTVLEIDRQKETLLITDNGNTVELKWNELLEVERIYYSDYRLKKDSQNYIPMPWRNYGLLRIQTSKETEFFFTSLMLDIVDPPITPTKNTYKYIPFLPQSLKEIENIKRGRIEKFKRNFKNLTDSELHNKFTSEELVKDARIAAEELIKEKNTAANKT